MWQVDQDRDFMAFERCCPYNDTGGSLYTTQTRCAAIYCFTWNEIAARGFDACVTETAVEHVANATKAGVLNSNVTTKSEGRCEYIDYKALKKGIVASAGSRKVSAFITFVTSTL
ncbi:hypothetical protein BKA64DRAFT_647329 [Cadophora sp. MPI-SDFR-AT-0126]|nr:hypothetical protein BKA64DRAFT_647329 [Leotiomycetes sp. MPI-SDFR-AT-0126]